MSEQQHIARIIRDELARRRLSRAELAARAKISLSSLEKALSGQRNFTMQTLVRLEEALEITIRQPASLQSSVAPESLGSYSRSAVKWIEGKYLTLRPAGSGGEGIYAYLTEIFWDAPQSSLAFRESERIDGEYAQIGSVSVPHQTGHIYLVTNRHGQYRLAILSRPLIKGEMFGVLTTLQTGRGSQLMPVAAPLALLPLKTPQPLGRIDQAHSQHARYEAILARAIKEDFARLLTPASPPTHP